MGEKASAGFYPRVTWVGKEMCEPNTTRLVGDKSSPMLVSAFEAGRVQQNRSTTSTGNATSFFKT